MKLQNHTLLPLAAVCGLALSAHAGVITPTAEVATGQFGDWLNTIDGFGLSDGGNSGDILSETHAGGGGGNFALFPGGPDYTGESITFTLPGASTVDRVHLWLDRSTWGDITGFDLEFSTDGGTTFPTTAAGITFDGAADLSVVQTRTFTEQTGVTDIRLSNVVVTGADSGKAYAGFNEIRFGGDAAPDITPPTLAGSDIVDDQGGGTVNENTLVTYTVTFSEDIDDTTVSSDDFNNAGTSPINFGAITETAPGVFTVEVAPTAVGTLQLQVPIGATIQDMAGLSMDTASAVLDVETLNVIVAPADNTKPTPDPMSFVSAPAANSATSITMEATPASDASGVEYLFTETSGNPGGDSSVWQGDTTYEDTGLTTGLVYTYTVTARDLSTNQNETAPSDPESATAEVPAVPVVITPVSEVATSQFGDFINTINGAGLSGGGTSGDILSETNVGGGGTFALFPGGPDFTGETVTFTLAEASTVDRIHLWVYNNGTWGTITGFDLEFSIDGGSTFPTTVTGLTFDGTANLALVQTRTFAEQTGVDSIRLSNVVVTGGDQAYAGLDEIRFGGTAGSGPSDDFNAWISDPAFGLDPADQGLDQDPDGDGNDNGVENFFGTDPSVYTAGILVTGLSGNTFTFTHPENAMPADDITAGYQWSVDLDSFFADGVVDGGVQVDFVATPDTPSVGTTTVVATITGPAPDKLFVNILVTTP